MKVVENKLRVCHFAQVPCEPFIVEVKDEFEAKKIVDVLAQQHLFLFDKNIISYYSNVIVVEMLEDGEWTSYWNENEMMEWDEIEDLLIESSL